MIGKHNADLTGVSETALMTLVVLQIALMAKLMTLAALVAQKGAYCRQAALRPHPPGTPPGALEATTKQSLRLSRIIQLGHGPTRTE